MVNSVLGIDVVCLALSEALQVYQTKNPRTHGTLKLLQFRR
jgi:hypothetical protein